MSKSRGNIIRPEPIQRVVGADGLRYYFLREMVFGQDSSFTYDALITRYNSDLANDYGNLASRILNMIERYFSGQIPYPSPGADRTDEDPALAAVAEQAITQSQQCFDRYDFSRGLEAVWSLVSATNKYLVETEPWVLAEDEAKRARLGTVLWTAAEGLRIIAALLVPVMPSAAERIWQQLGFDGEAAATRLDSLCWGQLPTGQPIRRADPIFPRLEREPAIEQMRALEEEAVGAASTQIGRASCRERV